MIGIFNIYSSGVSSFWLVWPMSHGGVSKASLPKSHMATSFGLKVSNWLKISLKTTLIGGLDKIG